jgi:GNAT superfamily N-acetyltransferase
MTRTGTPSQRHQGTDLDFAIAVESDAAAVAAVLNAAADHLTAVYGHGRWSGHASERSVLLSISPPVAGVRRSVTAKVLIARAGRGRARRIIGTLRLATKKPWAIDVAYFTPVGRALYLTAMAIEPTMQRQGVGRRMLDEAADVARRWPGDPVQAIRLDAYETRGPRGASDGGAGAGGFYARCGFREVGRVSCRGNPLVYFELLL